MSFREKINLDSAPFSRFIHSLPLSHTREIFLLFLCTDWCSRSLASVDWILNYKVFPKNKAYLCCVLEILLRWFLYMYFAVQLWMDYSIFFLSKHSRPELVLHFQCSTACLVGITGVLAPLLEETVFRGFLMVALTKWYCSSHRFHFKKLHSLSLVEEFSNWDKLITLCIIKEF